MAMKVRGYVAEDSRVAVLLVRLSRKCTVVCRLSTENGDTKVQIGSRFFGRFFPDRCDLSPDGTWFLYFVMGSGPTTDHHSCWTAVSRPPFLKAEVLLPQNDTWGGGGRFVGNTRAVVQPGLTPDFDVTKIHKSKNLSIKIDQCLDMEGGWASGHGWDRVTAQNPRRIRRRIEAPAWEKSRQRFCINRYLDTDNPKAGAFDRHAYTINDLRYKKPIALELAQPICWADFLSDESLIIATKSQVLIYANTLDVDQPPIQTFAFDLTLLHPVS